MYATMLGWWTASTAAKSRALNASSPFFMSASRCAVRLVVSVVGGMMAPFFAGASTAGMTVTLCAACEYSRLSMTFSSWAGIAWLTSITAETPRIAASMVAGTPDRSRRPLGLSAPARPPSPVAYQDPRGLSSPREQACSLGAHFADRGDKDHDNVFLECAIILVHTTTFGLRVYSSLALRDVDGIWNRPRR